MFTGIIRTTGKVKEIKPVKQNFVARISKPPSLRFRVGDSVAVNGLCSTVRESTSSYFVIEYMPETTKNTSIRHWKKGEILNLEPPLKLGDHLNGHFIQGHIDITGQVVNVEKVGNSKVLKIKFSRKHKKFVVPKGSIALNGVSLTVVQVKDNWFSVALVSYTLKESNLGQLKRGDWVNLEFDLIGKYLDSILNEKKAI